MTRNTGKVDETSTANAFLTPAESTTTEVEVPAQNVDVNEQPTTENVETTIRSAFEV